VAAQNTIILTGDFSDAACINQISSGVSLSGSCSYSPLLNSFYKLTATSATQTAYQYECDSTCTDCSVSSSTTEDSCQNIAPETFWINVYQATQELLQISVFLDSACSQSNPNYSPSNVTSGICTYSEASSAFFIAAQSTGGALVMGFGCASSSCTDCNLMVFHNLTNCLLLGPNFYVSVVPVGKAGSLSLGVPLLFSLVTTLLLILTK